MAAINIYGVRYYIIQMIVKATIWIGYSLDNDRLLKTVLFRPMTSADKLTGIETICDLFRNSATKT